MFVSSTHRRNTIRFIFYYDKSVPTGIVAEREIIHSYECVDNPTGTLAYKNFSIMSTEKQVVVDSQEATTTTFNVVNHHTQNFYKTIEDFYSSANPSDYTEVNNHLLNTCLEKGMDEEEGYYPEYIQHLVFMVSYQNQFLTALKEMWLRYKLIANPQINQ